MPAAFFVICHPGALLRALPEMKSGG